MDVSFVYTIFETGFITCRPGYLFYYLTYSKFTANGRIIR